MTPDEPIPYNSAMLGITGTQDTCKHHEAIGVQLQNIVTSNRATMAVMITVFLGMVALVCCIAGLLSQANDRNSRSTESLAHIVDVNSNRITALEAIHPMAKRP
jgi:hypothetical protein